MRLTGNTRFCADGVFGQETQAESAGWDADAATAFTAALQAGKPARMLCQNPDCTGVPADFEEKYKSLLKIAIMLE